MRHILKVLASAQYNKTKKNHSTLIFSEDGSLRYKYNKQDHLAQTQLLVASLAKIHGELMTKGNSEGVFDA